jgi:hypothetical protein
VSRRIILENADERRRAAEFGLVGIKNKKNRKKEKQTTKYLPVWRIALIITCGIEGI